MPALVRRMNEQNIPTLKVFLNEGYGGGETAFNHLNDQVMATV